MEFKNTQAFARQLDAADPLSKFRSQFHIPKVNGKNCVYFAGNSLGLQPKSAQKHINDELDNWAELGIDGYFEGRNPWLNYHDRFTHQTAKIVGALPEEVAIMHQLTVNLHLLMVSFYRPTPQRFKIICEAKAFPSDQYAFESQVKLHGFDPDEAIIEVKPRAGEHILHTEDILNCIKTHGDSVALVLFGGINYYTGQVMDMAAITEGAHAVGAFCGFDLAHAAGNVSLKLHDWDVDFACWCTYKYLNSGPGSVSGAFVHQKHITDKTIPRLAGWWGYDKSTRFMMEKGFKPIPTAEGWQLSCTPVFNMAAHKASLDIFEEAGFDNLLQKSRLLTDYLFFILNEINKKSPEKVIEVITPTEAGAHGCQVSLHMLQRGKEIFDKLTAAGIICDWREPNVIRAAPVPLYNRFQDVWLFGQVIERTLFAK